MQTTTIKKILIYVFYVDYVQMPVFLILYFETKEKISPFREKERKIQRGKIYIEYLRHLKQNLRNIQLHFQIFSIKNDLHKNKVNIFIVKILKYIL